MTRWRHWVGLTTIFVLQLFCPPPSPPFVNVNWNLNLELGGLTQSKLRYCIFRLFLCLLLSRKIFLIILDFDSKNPLRRSLGVRDICSSGPQINKNMKRKFCKRNAYFYWPPLSLLCSFSSTKYWHNCHHKIINTLFRARARSHLWNIFINQINHSTPKNIFGTCDRTQVRKIKMTRKNNVDYIYFWLLDEETIL